MIALQALQSAIQVWAYNVGHIVLSQVPDTLFTHQSDWPAANSVFRTNIANTREVFSLRV